MGTKYKAMGYKIEDKKDVFYVDKDYYKVANAKEIVNLKIINNKNKINIACNIIGKALGLNKESINLYELINKFTEAIAKKELVSIYCNIYNKSVSTFERSLENLVAFGIVRVTINDVVMLIEDYRLPDKITEAKYIVIEL